MPDTLSGLIDLLKGGGPLTVLLLCLWLLLKGEVVSRPIAGEWSKTTAALQTIAETSQRAIEAFSRQIEQIQASNRASGEELKRSLAEFTASNKQVYRLLDRLAEQNQHVIEQNQQVLEQNQQVLRQNQSLQQQVLERSNHPELVRRPV